ncbi:MAG: M20/M25/M40 family metallo-hydrolase [Acidobacteria bacterium]|nr:M20/M25/M40 family metallo-hydrolase [Acidobacteriota bacterium]
MKGVCCRLIFVASLLLATVAALAAPADVLVWIPRDSRAPAPAGPDVTLLAALETGWLVRVSPAALERQTAAGAAATALEPYRGHGRYYLVRLRDAGDFARVSAAGTAWRLEAATALFVAPAGSARELLPLDLMLRVLPEGPIDPSRAATTPAQRPAAVDHPLVGQLAAEVDETRLYAAVSDLQNFGSRNVNYAGCQQAGDYLYAFFQELGLPVEFEEFQFNTWSGSKTSRNVVATLPGETDSTVVIIGAHYDAMPQSTTAPGADDNASGTAAVMEAARILSRYHFGHTVRFIAFSAEEYGLWGSRKYVQSAVGRGESIVGMINLDMIAFADAVPEDLDLITNFASRPLAEQFAANAAAYAALDCLILEFESWGYSDHASFWDFGYPALCGIEDEDPSSPHYHTSHDTIDTLNFEFMTPVVRASVATLAELADPLYPSGDLNLDGRFDAVDVSVLRGYLSDNLLEIPAGAAAADFDGDQAVSVVDLTLLQLAAAG